MNATKRIEKHIELTKRQIEQNEQADYYQGYCGYNPRKAQMWEGRAQKTGLMIERLESKMNQAEKEYINAHYGVEIF